VRRLATPGPPPAHPPRREGDTASSAPPAPEDRAVGGGTAVAAAVVAPTADDTVAAAWGDGVDAIKAEGVAAADIDTGAEAEPPWPAAALAAARAWSTSKLKFLLRGLGGRRRGPKAPP